MQKTTTSLDARDPHDDLRDRELKVISGNAEATGGSSSEPSIWGLALSGGGIRSATFALGVLQALAECRWLSGFHYLSTVSGGGYIGAYLQGLIHRRGIDGAMDELARSRARCARLDDRVPHAEPRSASGETLRQLRAYSNFLTPDKAVLSADRVSLVTTYLANMLLTQVQIAAALLLLAFVPLLAYTAVARLSTSPWFAWALAALAMFLAFMMRGRTRHRRRKQRARRNNLPPRAPGRGLSLALAPVLLAASMVCLAALLWGGSACSGLGGGGWCGRWTELHKDARGECRLNGWFEGLCLSSPDGQLQPAALALVYAIGLTTWLVWWVREEGDIDRFGWRLLRHLLIGMLTTILMVVFAWMLAQWTGGDGFSLVSTLDRAPPPPPPLDAAASGVGATVHLWNVLVLGPPLVFATFFAASLVHVGLTLSHPHDRVIRERWARLIGRTFVLLLVFVSLPAALIAWGPWAVRQAAEWINGQEQGVLQWLLPLIPIAAGATGARVAYSDQTGSHAPQGRWSRVSRRALVAAAPWALIIGVLLLAAVSAEALLRRTGPHLSVLPWLEPTERDLALVQAELHMLELHALLFTPNWGALLLLIAGIAAIGLLFSRYVDENESSMNAFYRNRLVRCYLGPTNPRRRADADTDLDPEGDDIVLAELLVPEWQAPRDGPGDSGGARRARPLYPLIGATANLTATRDLDWQDRKAASFVFSPLFCGHFPLPRPYARAIGDQPQKQPAPHDTNPSAPVPGNLAADTTLGTAISISGAAISPHMGYRSSPAIAFLLTLFNARLGWWVENFNVDQGVLGLLRSKLLSELLSRSGDRARYTYVSDGGHFENLGIYELVRRRCSFIMSVDASADPDRDFEGLGNAIHKCRVDLGAEIDIDVSLMRPDAKGVSARCATLGKITYADGSRALLLYMKPSLTGHEPADVAHYASANRAFPHQTTGDQFFDEHQFEAYRALGYGSGHRVLLKTMARLEQREQAARARNGLSGASQNAHDADGAACDRGESELRLADRRKEEILVELEHWLFEPSSAVALRLSRHGAAFSELLQRQGATRALRSLDEQIFPGWAGVTTDRSAVHARGQGHLAMPDAEDFRECFYFVQQLFQFMETVYLDLDLGRNIEHPDNRGWINLFRQWAWVPMCRVAWVMTAQTRGSRFVRFCETELGLPDVVSGLRIEWLRAKHPRLTLKRLPSVEEFSFIEREILGSDAVAAQCEGHAWDVGRLQIDWNTVLGTTCPPSLNNQAQGFGLAIVAGGALGSDASEAPARNAAVRLIVARIQDHVRRTGLGCELVYQVLLRYPKTDPQIRAGHYGETIGTLKPQVSARQTEELAKMVDRACRRLGNQG